jgi:Response regulator containing a CheY-like receiver domain and an HTH DNA-binding domain
MPGRIIHVAIIEDDEDIRNALTYIINGTPGFHCRHTFVDSESAIKELPSIYVNVVLVDIELPGISGIESVRILKSQMTDVDFVMLSVRQDDEAIFASLCAGATGYLAKDTPPHILLKGIEEVANGGSPMSASIARRVVSTFNRSAHISPLSKRETEVLGLLCQGKNYKIIAQDLYISGHTVQAHVKNIYRKLEVNSRGEAVSKAINEGLI